MKLALIADTFPPDRTSGAVQLRDLAREMVSQGHELTVILPDPTIADPFKVETIEDAIVLRLKTPAFKDSSYIWRTLAELLMPHLMKANLKHSPLNSQRWDGVLWYSPSIFFAPLVRDLKRRSRCKAYLIVRDIFPEWALDLGIMRRGPVYWFFRIIAAGQYRAADVIGVQSPGNLAYFARRRPSQQRLEVLVNWLAAPAAEPCSIDVQSTPLAGRQIAVYAGNMGVAQGVDAIIAMAEAMVHRQDVGFLLVGRGSEVCRLKALAMSRGLTNVAFNAEIPPDQIPALYAQCHLGLVALDPRHKSHNIPGKFISYIQSGLPVLACINPGNDLGNLIRNERVGLVCEGNDGVALAHACSTLIEDISRDGAMRQRCLALFERSFGAGATASQIVAALAGEPRNGPDCQASANSNAAAKSI
jgi:glycosyltransferase involved in cell wall biosynthesis